MVQLSVQLAGAAFVPVDLDNPVEWVNFVVQDARLRLFICSSEQLSTCTTAIGESAIPSSCDRNLLADSSTSVFIITASQLFQAPGGNFSDVEVPDVVCPTDEPDTIPTATTAATSTNTTTSQTGPGKYSKTSVSMCEDIWISEGWCGVNSSNICHAFYTSGSTGRPKGVLVEHRHMANYILERREPDGSHTQ